MNFCPKCNYLLDITKIDIDDNKDVILKLSTLFELLASDTNISNYTIEVSLDDVLQSKKYTKLSSSDKKIIDKLYENNNKIISSKFICNYCNYTKNITKTTLIYQLNSEITSKKLTNSDIFLMINDPLIPHTNDYTCINKECETHKNFKLKDAIFYKDRGIFAMQTICTVCNHKI